MIQRGGFQGEQIAKIVIGHEAAARGKHLAEVIGQALVIPEQFVAHGLLVIRRGQSRRTPVFAVPRMHHFVRQQVRVPFPRVRVRQKILVQPVVARLVMFQAEMADVVAQGEQEMIIAIVMRAEQRIRLRDQVRKMARVLRFDFQRGGAVGDDVQEVRRISARRQIQRSEKFPRDDRRIN